MIKYTGTSVPTVDNIDTILQWRDVGFLAFYDENSLFVIDLLERMDEMRRMTKLKKLRFSLQKETYDIVNIAELIHALPTLNSVELVSIELDDAQKKEFTAKNPAPMNWSTWMDSSIIYYKHDESMY